MVVSSAAEVAVGFYTESAAAMYLQQSRRQWRERYETSKHVPYGRNHRPARLRWWRHSCLLSVEKGGVYCSFVGDDDVLLSAQRANTGARQMAGQPDNGTKKIEKTDLFLIFQKNKNGGFVMVRTATPWHVLY